MRGIEAREKIMVETLMVGDTDWKIRRHQMMFEARNKRSKRSITRVVVVLLLYYFNEDWDARVR